MLSKRRPSGRSSTAGTISRCGALVCVFLGLSSALPQAASAHGISGLTSLPVPAWLFAWAAAVVLVVSFVLLTAMWSRPRLQNDPGRRLCSWPRSLQHPLRRRWGFAVCARDLCRLRRRAGLHLEPRSDVHLRDLLGRRAASSGVFGNWFRAFNPWLAVRSRIALGWREGQFAMAPAAVVSAVAGAMADRRGPGRVRLARARLSRPRQSLDARVSLARVLRTDAGRHEPVRRRDVERSRRCVRWLLRADSAPVRL